MRFSIALLMTAVVALTVAPLVHGHRISEHLDKRIAELNKWFEARIPIYKNANYLLRKLGVEVAKLSDLHNGIDFYYEGSEDLQYYGEASSGSFSSTKLRVLKVNGTGVDTKPIEDVVQKALAQRDVKNILTLAPEIKSAFKSIMRQQQ